MGVCPHANATQRQWRPIESISRALREWLGVTEGSVMHNSSPSRDADSSFCKEVLFFTPSVLHAHDFHWTCHGAKAVSSYTLISGNPILQLRDLPGPCGLRAIVEQPWILTVERLINFMTRLDFDKSR